MIKRILLNYNFSLLWASSVINSLGNQLSIIGFPLIGIILYETGAFETSLITVLTFIPNLLLGSHIGVFVDKYRKKKVLVVTNILSSILLFVLYFMALSSTLPLIGFYIGIFLLSTLMIFSSLGFYAQIPLVVDKRNLQGANYRLEVSNSFIQTGGPSVGGFIVQLFSAPFIFLLDGLSFLFTGIIQSFIKEDEIKQSTSSNSNTSYFKQIKESYVFVFSHKILSSLAQSYFIVVVAIGLFQSLQIFYLSEVLKFGPSKLGLILSLGNVGLIISTFISNKLSYRLGSGNAVVISLALYALGFIIYALSTPNTIILVIIGQIILSMAPPIYNINVLTMRQKLVRPNMLARAAAIWRVFGRGLVPLGALIGGLVAQFFSVKIALYLASVIGIVGLIPIIKSVELRQYRDN